MTKLLNQLVQKAKSNWLWAILTILTFSIVPTYLQYEEGGFGIIFWYSIGSLFIVFIVFILIPVLISRWKINKSRRELVGYLDFLDYLTDEFLALKKTIKFNNNLSSDKVIRSVRYLFMEKRLCAVLNVGQEENTQTGSRFILYILDDFTNEGEFIEKPVALLNVTNVQSDSNLSIAEVYRMFDVDYWENIRNKLDVEHKVNPSNNIVKPFLMGRNSSELSLDDIETINDYLTSFRDYISLRNIN